MESRNPEHFPRFPNAPSAPVSPGYVPDLSPRRFSMTPFGGDFEPSCQSRQLHDWRREGRESYARMAMSSHTGKVALSADSITTLPPPHRHPGRRPGTQYP